MSEAPSTTVIVLAAGEGTRMRSKTMKVLHPVCGRSMVGHVLGAARDLEPERVVVVVGHGRDQVGTHVRDVEPEALLAVQEVQDGTGSAVRVAMDALKVADGTAQGTVVVAYGDTPLLQGETLRTFVADHTAAGRAMSILTGVVPDPFGYGRIIRDEAGGVARIVEQKDATAEEAAVTEINSGIMAFDVAFLREALPRLGNDNAKREYYLTDTVQIAREAGCEVGAYRIDDVRQTEGANDRAQLASLGAEMNRRIVERWMRDGVTFVDPATSWVDVDVQLARDVTIHPGVQLRGRTRVEEDAEVGPDTTLTDVQVGAGARVVRTHGSDSVIGAGASVGPFAYLRPGTVLGADGKIGTFVETKNSRIGERSKVPHLSYVGDAEIGEGSNIGAGTIFANYDGVAKHRTRIGSHVRTGSHNTFIAPVEVGDGAVTGGGTVVRRDVPPGSLAVSAGTQRHVEEWTLHKRAGTPAAEAARAALEEPGDGGPSHTDQS